MAKRKPTTEPVPGRKPSTPVRVPDDLIVELDEVSAATANATIQLSRVDVLVAAAREGLPALRARVLGEKS